MLTSWIPASKNFAIEVPIGKNSVLNTTSRTIFFVKIEFDTSENFKVESQNLEVHSFIQQVVETLSTLT